uniref:Uncharacterized protein n=1 Tax=Opuntia streptacantha TaxID=393608 RepID=A0A7C9ARG8_OPUST
MGVGSTYPSSAKFRNKYDLHLYLVLSSSKLWRGEGTLLPEIWIPYFFRKILSRSSWRKTSFSEDSSSAISFCSISEVGLELLKTLNPSTDPPVSPFRFLFLENLFPSSCSDLAFSTKLTFNPKSFSFFSLNLSKSLANFFLSNLMPANKKEVSSIVINGGKNCKTKPKS